MQHCKTSILVKISGSGGDPPYPSPAQNISEMPKVQKVDIESQTMRPAFDRPSPDMRPASDRPSPDMRPAFDRPSTTMRPALDRPSPATRPAFDRPSPAMRPALHRPSPAMRPALDRPSTGPRPVDVDLKTSIPVVPWFQRGPPNFGAGRPTGLLTGPIGGRCQTSYLVRCRSMLELRFGSDSLQPS